MFVRDDLFRIPELDLQGPLPVQVRSSQDLFGFFTNITGAAPGLPVVAC